MAEDGCGPGEPVSKVLRVGETPEREVAADVHGINIDRLPDEMLINIFSSLGFNELIDIVQNVCLRWRRLAHDPTLWLDKEYIVRGRSVVPLLKQCSTSLRKLRLVFFDTPRAMEAVAFEALGELHSLHELSIQYLGTFEPQLISRAFRPGCLTQLRRLLMQYTTDLLDETVITISQGCPNLRELRICASYKITDVALSEIHCLKHLEILELSRCNGLSGTAMAYISQLPTLHTLILQCTEDLAKLLPSLRLIVELKELRCLDILKSGNIKAVPFDEFPNRLLKLRELRVTYESENDFTELQRKMPNLKISNTAWVTEDDFPKDDDADYSHHDG
ncbi:S-phase kinase-associated protein 2-like isoform X2 [Schistocerca gregaria]|uniref:S-phase kinase-associated protein 2-like isoform X2 n=1 Tax=Schistocerca gregaria TaxID=7010 RepID=UPI00211E7C8E|nr:S-phase kinase-associated protein 2-like isoform X2 [Schistocerca gregaria]